MKIVLDTATWQYSYIYNSVLVCRNYLQESNKSLMSDLFYKSVDIKFTTHDSFLEPSSSGPLLAGQIFECQIMLTSLEARTPKDLNGIA